MPLHNIEDPIRHQMLWLELAMDPSADTGSGYLVLRMALILLARVQVMMLHSKRKTTCDFSLNMR